MADRLVSVDSETLRFPDAVSEQIGVDAEDRSTPLGGAVDRVARRAPFEPVGLSEATVAGLSGVFATLSASNVWTGGNEFQSAPTIRQPGGLGTWWKTETDTNPGAWDLLVSHQAGYGLHVQTRAPGKAPGYIIALGLDEDGGDPATLGIGGLLIPNKKGARGITINQYAAITHADAYGLNVLQNSSLAPAVRLEQLSETGESLLQLFSTVSSTSTARLLDVVIAGGRAGSVSAGTGQIDWVRPITTTDQEAVDSYFQAGAKGSTPSNQRSYTRLRKDSLSFLGYSGSAGTWYPRAIVMNGQDLELRAGGNTTSIDTVAATAVMKIRNAAMAFFGGTPATKYATLPADATDLASAIALVNSIKNNVLIRHSIAA